jgi:O-antigen/teichoic acid export membrane protein
MTKNSELKNSFSNAFFLMGASILSIPLMAISEILQGRYMTNVGYEEYASFAYAIAFISILTGVCFNWINVSYFRLAKDDLIQTGSVSTYNTFYLIFGFAKLFLVVLFLFTFTDFFRTTLNIPVQLSNLQIILILIIVLFKNFLFTLLKTLNHLKTTATIEKLFQKFLFASMVLVLFLHFQILNYDMMIKAFIINEVLALLTLFIVTPKKYIRFTFEAGKKLATFVKVSITNYVAVISLSLVANIDLIIINMYLNAELLSNYSAAYKIFTLIKAIVSGNLFTVFMPIIVKFHIRKETYKVIHLFYKTLTKQLALMLLFIFILFTPFVDFIINSMYEAKFLYASNILHILLVVSYTSSIHFATHVINDVYLIIKERTLISILGAALNILLDIYLIPYYGVIGAAYVTLFVVYLQTFLFQLVIKKKLSVYNSYLTFLPFIYLVYTLLIISSANIPVKILITILFCTGILFFSFKKKLFLISDLELFSNVKLPKIINVLLKKICRF